MLALVTSLHILPVLGFFAVAVVGVGIVIFAEFVLRARSAANNNLKLAQTKMFAAAEKLVDSGNDIPEDIVKLVITMVKISRMGGVEWGLVHGLAESKKPGNQNLSLSKDIKDLDNESQRNLYDFLAGWIQYVSNRSFIARIIIRQRLGRSLERHRHYQPASAGLVEQALKWANGRNDHSGGAAA